MSDKARRIALQIAARKAAVELVHRYERDGRFDRIARVIEKLACHHFREVLAELRRMRELDAIALALEAA